jgi:hypothetical protein
MQVAKERQPWKDPANWHMVTPNAGKSITIPRLVQEFNTAAATSEEELRAWASQHLNVEIGSRSWRTAGPGAVLGGQARDGGLTLEQLLERSEVVTIGVDGGGLDDLLGLTVLGRERETGHWLAWSHGWAHEIVLERRKEIAPQLLDFAAGGQAHHRGARRRRRDASSPTTWSRSRRAGMLPREKAIGVDPAGVGGIVDAIVASGIDFERITGISQGWKLGGAIKTAERKLAGGELWHAGEPFMAWCVGNAKVEPRANGILITKQASGTAKIDPLMALFDAVSLMALNPEAQGGSFWDAKPEGAGGRLKISGCHPVASREDHERGDIPGGLARPFPLGPQVGRDPGTDSRDLRRPWATKSGRTVNLATAIQVSAVFACNRVIGNGMAQVPLKLMRESGKTRLPATDHPLYTVMGRKPNPWQTSFEFREMMSWHVELAGRFVAFKNAPAGRILELIPFEPARSRSRGARTCRSSTW